MNLRVAKIQHRRSAAFTMIELLIVIAIVPIVSAAMYLMIGRLHTAGDQLQMRINAAEEAQYTAARWRADVALASRVEIDSPGASMNVFRKNQDGTEATVQYAVNDRGEIERVTAGEESKREILARGIGSLEFRAAGSGFAMKLAARTHDGTREFKWEHEAFATPLAGAKASAVETGAVN
jgi:prepilin-type N-terminal cleavage/methylation domain-containing protein